MTPSPNQPRQYPGRPISADMLNRLNEYARAGSNMPPINSDDSGGGTTPTTREVPTGGWAPTHSAIVEIFPARLTSNSGWTFPGSGGYTFQRLLYYDSSQTGVAKYVTDGVNITGVMNTMELAGTPSYTFGTGNTITASDGTVNSGSCKVIALGVGPIYMLIHMIDVNTGNDFYCFTAENSAQ